MKIRFRKVTNIRIDNQSLTSAPLGVVYANTVLEVEDQTHEGATVNGDNRWWRDQNGWFYWAGETEALPSENTPAPTPPVISTPPTPPPAPPPPPPPTKPPVAAVEFVALPVPEDHPVANLNIPEGEWRSLDAISPEPVLAQPENTGFESLSTSPALVQAAPPPPIPDLILNPKAQRLNWGLESGQIPTQWWKEKQLTGRGISIAMLCTGADANHPDLSGITANFSSNPADNQSIEDTNGLGTQAAIIAAGKGQLAYGVAPEAKLLIGKIGNNPNDITPESLMAGLEWAIVQKADVAALLVDFLTISDLQKNQLQEVIARALDAQIILLAPVGNSSERRPEDRFPAALEGVISVGAHHSFNRRAEFSAKSYQLDFLAPGDGLNTSDLNQNIGPNLKNTAIATAYAAGFMALIQQWAKQQTQAYSPTDLSEFLHETAHYEGINKGKDTEMGYGILNPQAILKGLAKAV